MNNATQTEASAIFVDLENMVLTENEPGVKFRLTPIMARVGPYQPLLRKAYGNWHRFPDYGADFVGAAFELMQYYSGNSRKNGADIQLAVDAVETVFLWPHLTTIFLVSGDSDFCPLVRTLHKYQRRVIGIGWLKSTSGELRRHCDHFWVFDDLLRFTEPQLWANSDDVTRLIYKVTADLGPGTWVAMTTLKTAMLRYDPSFDEKQHGFSTFVHFFRQKPD